MGQKRLVLILIRASTGWINLHWHVRHMDVYKVSLACPMPKLSQCLNEGHTFNIANSATLADGKFQTEEYDEISEQIASPSWFVDTYQLDLKRICQ